MPKVNYGQLKRRREEAKKKEQNEKQARRGRVPTESSDGSFDSNGPGPAPGTMPPRTPSA